MFSLVAGVASTAFELGYNGSSFKNRCSLVVSWVNSSFHLRGFSSSPSHLAHTQAFSVASFKIRTEGPKFPSPRKFDHSDNKGDNDD